MIMLLWRVRLWLRHADVNEVFKNNLQQIGSATLGIIRTLYNLESDAQREEDRDVIDARVRLGALVDARRMVAVRSAAAAATASSGRAWFSHA